MLGIRSNGGAQCSSGASFELDREKTGGEIMFRVLLTKCLLLAFVALSLTVASIGDAAAQSSKVADFYRGKQLRFIIG